MSEHDTAQDNSLGTGLEDLDYEDASFETGFNEEQGLTETVLNLLSDNLPLIIGAIGIFVTYKILKFFIVNELARKRFLFYMPFVGLLSKLSKDKENADGNYQGWTHGELELCEAFYIEPSENSKVNAEKARDYINKIELGQKKPLHPFAVKSLILLFFVEAIGFAYVISQFAAVQSSEFSKIGITILVSCVLAALFGTLTHSVGKYLYRRKIAEQIVGSANRDNPDGITFDASPMIKLEDTTEDDPDKEKGIEAKDYLQRMNRFAEFDSYIDKDEKENGKVFLKLKPNVNLWFFVASVLLAATLIFGVRLFAYDKVTGKAKQVQSSYDSSFSAAPSYPIGGEADNEAADPFLESEEDSLPTALTNSQNNARGDLEEQIQTSDRLGSLLVYGIMSGAFVGVQIIALLVMASGGLAGAHSQEAYKEILRHEKREQYASIGKKYLPKLQSKMKIRGQNKKLFHEYIKLRDEQIRQASKPKSKPSGEQA